MPIISILTTSYNREDLLGEAIESVLASSFTDFEYIIVDDCSSDASFDIAKGYEKLDSRVKAYRNSENLGDYVNRNKAAGYANGKYLKYLDSDDLLYNHGLQAMVYSMEKFPEAGFGLSAKRDDAKPYPACLTPREAYLEHFNGYGHFNRAPGSAIIKRAAFEKVGGFSGARYIGDIELWFTLAKQFAMVKFPTDLYWSRMHEVSEGANEKMANTDHLRRSLINTFILAPDCPVTPKEIKLSFPKKVKQTIGRLL